MPRLDLSDLEYRLLSILRTEREEFAIRERNRCVEIIRSYHPEMGLAEFRELLVNGIVGHVPTDEDSLWMEKLRKALAKDKGVHNDLAGSH